MMEKIEQKKLQMKITDALKQLPENRRKIIAKEEEKEQRMMMKEAKQELWRKWRNRNEKKQEEGPRRWRT